MRPLLDMGSTDWGEILRACRDAALAMGLGKADADDVSAEAALRAFERSDKVSDVLAYAFACAERLARKLLTGREGGARSERGIVLPLPIGADIKTLSDGGALERQLDAREVLRHVPSETLERAVAGGGSAVRMARKRMRDSLAIDEVV